MPTNADDFIAISDTEIYRAIGRYIELHTLGSLPPSDPEVVATGRRWLEQTLAQSRERLCNSPLIKSVLAISQPDTALTLSAVAGALVLLKIIDTNASGAETALFSFAAYVCKRGLGSLCQSDREP